MARTKPRQSSQVKAETEHDNITPFRRTRRQTKSLVEPQDASVSEPGDLEEAEPVLAPSPSPSPSTKPKAKRKARKSNAVKAPSRLTDDATPEPAPQLAKDGRRKGGNKRKWTHEYCLTCTNYGRACGGRREGEPGCAVCREPNREKGEKLRECLWADPEAGIATYKEAREEHKRSQAEARAQKAKAPKRPAPTVDLIHTESPSTNYLPAPDPLGIVPHPRAVDGPRPQLSRPLDVLPPPGTARPSPTNGAHTNSSSHGPQMQDGNGITVNASWQARHQSPPNIPGVHRPQVINLPNGQQTHDGILPRASLPQPVHYFPPPTLPAGLSPLPESFAPYYDPKQGAYILPVYPHSNLLPPPAFMRHHAETYISPYDAHPSIPVTMNGRHPPRAVFPTELPPRNTGFSIPPPLKLKAQKAQPLDRTGTPCRKWSRSDSKVTTLSGYEFKSKGWKRGINGSARGGSQELGPMATKGKAVSSNAVSTETDVQESAASSELSSAIDVDETMLTTTRQNNDDNDEDMVEAVGIAPYSKYHPVLDGPQQNEAAIQSDEDEEPDRFQAFIKNVYEEKINGTKRKRGLSPEATSSATGAARFIPVNEDYDDSDDSGLTESEGEDKVVPANARNTAANIATSNNAWKSFPAPAPKGQAGRGRAARSSAASSHYEDAAEQSAHVNSFAAVNSKKRNGDTSLEHKRKILAMLQDGDAEMDEA